MNPVFVFQSLIGVELMRVDTELISKANQIRQANVGDEVHLRGLIEISNYCRCNCLYCGLRKDNQRIRRYRMTPAEILSAARLAAEFGYGTVVLQAGEDPEFEPMIIAGLIEQIKKLGLAVTLSLGEWERQTYLLWKKAGADRYLMRHETANPELYSILKPGKRLSNRIKNLETLRELDYQIGAGFMIGLPGGFDVEHKADLALLTHLQPDMAGVGPFIPNPDTPLECFKAPPLENTLSILAQVRLALPSAHLPATTALESLYPQGYEWGLMAGANVIMPNLTPLHYQHQYQLYPGKAQTRNAAAYHQRIMELLNKLGKPTGKGPGHSTLWERRQNDEKTK